MNLARAGATNDGDVGLLLELAMPDALMSATVVAVILLVLVGYIALIRAIISPSRDPDDAWSAPAGGPSHQSVDAGRRITS